MLRPALLILAACFACLAGYVRGQEVVLDFAAVRETNQLTLSSDGGEVEIISQGQDPYLWIQLPDLQSDVSAWVFEMEYFCTSGIAGPQLRLGKPARAEGYLSLPSIPAAEGWTIYTAKVEGLSEFVGRRKHSPFLRLDLGRRSNVRLRLRHAVLRPVNDKERELEANAERISSRKEKKARELLQYWAGEHRATIDTVTVDGGDILIRGQASGGTNLRLRARSIADHEVDPTWLVDASVEADAGGAFESSISTEQLGGVPSGLVAWQLFQGDASQSAVRYGPVVETRQASSLPALPPRKSRKGLTGIRSEVTPEQLKELGIQHGVINIVLNGLVQRDEQAGWIPFDALGRTWWASPARLGSTDRVVRNATRAGVQLATTLLIRPGKSVLVHPEYDAAGHYSIPNLTSRQSSELYVATLEFLAQRYSRPDSQHGRIDHWIVHNEVDYGWQWTNMGSQPVELFMDHYVRSMRIVDATTRRHNPHARTFISLTHRWNVADNQPWKTYAPKRMMELLLAISKLEGNFPWGVAYHPYPQSLWDARTWGDQKVDQTFDTELITIKNLEVLDRFMNQPELLFDGQVRPVICSEQGFHAPTDDPKLLDRQCAALVYTWMQLEKCDSILAFDYHRPIDHPREGGLQLGLRGFTSRAHPHGIAKPGWDVYRQLGTDTQPDLEKQYQRFWEK